MGAGRESISNNVVTSYFVIRNIFGLPFSGTELLKLRISFDESYKSAFCYVIEVTLRKHLRVGTSCLENQPF